MQSYCREISVYRKTKPNPTFSRKIFETDRKGSADDVWNHMLSACDKLTQAGTVWALKILHVSMKRKGYCPNQLRKSNE